jgi:hypothetical protein
MAAFGQVLHKEQHGLRGARNSVFVCLANLTEARLVTSIDEEVEFYVSCVRPLVDQERTIIIKGHPRQQLQQAERLASRLQSIGYQAHCALNGHLAPVEFLAPILPVSLVISLLSNSGLTWRLLRPETSILWGVQPELIDRYFARDAWDNDLSSIYMGFYAVLMTLGPNGAFSRFAVEQFKNT